MTRSIDTILEQFRSSLEEENSELANFPQYGNLYAIFRAIGASILEQDVKLDNINSDLFLTTATGVSLDKKAEEFNIKRKEGTASSGSIICSGPSLAIPAGTILIHPNTKLQFKILEKININNSISNGFVECTEYTPLGNLGGGIQLVSSIYTNITFTVGNTFDPFTSSYIGSLVGGSFKEEDAQLKNRILATLQSLSLSTIQALQLEALNINGINKVAVIENEPSLGYITIYVNSNQTNIIKLVEQKLNTIKPVGVALQVKSFSNIPINIDINIRTISQNINNTDVNNTLIQLLQEYLESLNTGDTISKEALVGILFKSNLITNAIILNPTSNIELKNNELAYLNNVNISYI